MNRRSTILTFAAAAGLTGAFLLGRGTTHGLDAQGTGTRSPALPPPIGPGTLEPAPERDDVPIYPVEAGSAAASANGFIAVTGSYGVGTSVLYVIDTESRQLAVYEARGGTRSMRRLNLVGARRIDLDLMLRGYNDESEYSYAALERMFAQQREPAGRSESVRATETSTDRR